jgi:hypothetical protein
LRSLNGALVVRQTRAVHREIQTRLDQMRRVALAEDKKDERVKDAKAPKEEDPAALKLVVYPLGHYPAADLGRAIPEFVVPESWKAAGGKGTIHAVQGALIVRQTRAVHTAIVDLLYQLPIWEAAPPIVPGAPATPPAGNPNPTPAKPEEKK